MAGSFGNTPWGGGAWGGSVPTSTAGTENIPVSQVWNLFDIGGVSRTDINRLSDFIEVTIAGVSDSHFVSSWNIASGGSYSTTIAYLRFDVPVYETFTIEYNVKFNALPEDFSNPLLSHLYLGAWSAQDFAVGLLFSKAGVAYTGEVSISP